MPKIRRSRRVSGPRDGDYDHEIALVNHDTPPSPTKVSATTVLSASPSSSEEHQPPHSRPSARSATTRPSHDAPQGPSIQVQASTPLDAGTESAVPATRSGQRSFPASKKGGRDAAVDILYENERGGFLCGRALFSPRALGNLDPAPWTNAFHRKSRTDTRTTQLPDPSWEWGWPEWRVNQREWTDEAGWEYSFAFSTCFSWHGPKWWNSFVRRRAWIRRRVRAGGDGLSGGDDPQMIRADYFSIKPVDHGPSSNLARAVSRTSRTSRSGSAADDRQTSSLGQASAVGDEDCINITDADMLLDVFRGSRIDREKLEAVDNYLEHGHDLESLAKHMHQLMGMFIYQASRRLLLTRLMQAYNQNDGNDHHQSTRSQALEKAVKHADDEVKRLAYWSDAKCMTEGGLSKSAAEEQHGWDQEKWSGIDQSGPAVPGGGELPGQ